MKKLSKCSNLSQIYVKITLLYGPKHDKNGAKYITKLQKYVKVTLLYQPKNEKNTLKFEKVVKTTALYSLKMTKK